MVSGGGSLTHPLFWHVPAHCNLYSKAATYTKLGYETQTLRIGTVYASALDPHHHLSSSQLCKPLQLGQPCPGGRHSSIPHHHNLLSRSVARALSLSLPWPYGTPPPNRPPFSRACTHALDDAVTNPFGEYLDCSSIDTALSGLATLSAAARDAASAGIRIRLAIGAAQTKAELMLVPQM